MLCVCCSQWMVVRPGQKGLELILKLYYLWPGIRSGVLLVAQKKFVLLYPFRWMQILLSSRFFARSKSFSKIEDLIAHEIRLLVYYFTINVCRYCHNCLHFTLVVHNNFHSMFPSSSPVMRTTSLSSKTFNTLWTHWEKGVEKNILGYNNTAGGIFTKPSYGSFLGCLFTLYTLALYLDINRKRIWKLLVGEELFCFEMEIVGSYKKWFE